jgi:ammonium transporter, Amt family
MDTMTTYYKKWILGVLLFFPAMAMAASYTPAYAGHTFWVMLSGILVIFMTIPGIAIFYGGLVHRRNVLSVYTQCLAMAAIASICWLFFGYALTFGAGQSYGYLFFGRWTIITLQNGHYLVHLFYQMGFAMISVVIISGGFAERMKLSAALAFTPLWLLLVYCPIAHWVWGGGWLEKIGAMDFAGGTVVHLNAGIAGLVAAMMIGRRKVKPGKPHSLSIVTIGTSILWIGWFGFNSGSAHDFKSTIMALINTQFAPSAAALTWMAVEWAHRKKPSARGLLFGVITGLVAITPAAGYCTPFLAMAIGIISAVVSYFAVHLKEYFGYDDALDAFGIHGVAGIVGALLTGVVASHMLGGSGLHTGNMFTQLMAQCVAIISVLIWSGSWTYLILWGIKKTIGLRVSEDGEEQGLNIHEHGEVYD